MPSVIVVIQEFEGKNFVFTGSVYHKLCFFLYLYLSKGNNLIFAQFCMVVVFAQCQCVCVYIRVCLCAVRVCLRKRCPRVAA